MAEVSADSAFLAAELRQSRQQLEFALEAGRLGSWELDVASNRLVSSEYCRTIFGLTAEDPFERYEDIVARVHPDDRKKREDAVANTRSPTCFASWTAKAPTLPPAPWIRSHQLRIGGAVDPVSRFEVGHIAAGPLDDS